MEWENQDVNHVTNKTYGIKFTGQNLLEINKNTPYS